MRALILAAALAVGAAQAQEADAPEIRGVIQDQIDAFLVDDFEEAFTHASPMIRGMFGTPERFGAMVRQGYPMVWRPSDVEFQGQREADGSVMQRLYVRGPSGDYHYLEYEMIPTEGGWKINGVQVIRAPGVGA